MNFWQKLPKPFTVLAPMDDVTDVVFREVVAGGARPDVFFTEFTNADGLTSEGFDRVSQKLKYTENQRPIVAQIWGNNPETMFGAAKIVKELGFDGVDINMGCPVREVVKRNAGAGLIGNFDLSKKIIDAVKKGAKGIPVSIKTRLGKNTNIAVEWATFLLKEKIDALTIHGRTAKQMSKGEADWEEIGAIVQIKKEISPDILLIGNGDIENYDQALKMHKKYGVDGIMVGRGIFTNPWVFQKENVNHTSGEAIDMLKEHLSLFDKTWGDKKNFAIMKKFFKMYIKGFDGANKLRQLLMDCQSLTETRNLLLELR